MPKISVIVPAYNCGKYLSETLDSVIAQTLVDWECIVVDDGSTDNTGEVAENYCSLDARFKCIHQENGGPSVARNNGILHSSGKYICPLDGDDLIEKTYLEKATCYLDVHPQTKLVYCYAKSFGSQEELLRFPAFVYDDFIWQNSLFCYAVYRRCDFDNTTGYNPNMVFGQEDWDFFLSLLDPSDEVHCIDEFLFFYRKHADSRSAVLPEKQKEMLVQICRNHPDIYGNYKEEILFYHNQLLNTQDQLKQASKEIERLKATKAYKIGKTLLAPFRWFRKH